MVGERVRYTTRVGIVPAQCRVLPCTLYIPGYTAAQRLTGAVPVLASRCHGVP